MWNATIRVMTKENIFICEFGNVNLWQATIQGAVECVREFVVLPMSWYCLYGNKDMWNWLSADIYDMSCTGEIIQMNKLPWHFISARIQQSAHCYQVSSNFKQLALTNLNASTAPAEWLQIPNWVILIVWSHSCSVTWNFSCVLTTAIVTSA